jgi:hypothetical protein
VTTRLEHWTWRITAVGLVSVVVATTLVMQFGFLFGSVTGSTTATRAAPCLPGREVEIMDSPHVSQTDIASVRYNSLPPTSGPHFAFTITTGIYADPVPEALTVHAMEHGHVVLQYASGTLPDAVERLRRLAKRYSKDVILAPYPKLDNGIALTAWGRIDQLDSYDEPRATAFVERLRNRYVHGWSRAQDCR